MSVTDFMRELETYRNAGRIYAQFYYACKKMKNFDFSVPVLTNDELDTISEAVFYTIDYIEKNGFDSLPAGSETTANFVEPKTESFSPDTDDEIVEM